MIEPMETIHIYYEQDEPTSPTGGFDSGIAFLCLMCFCFLVWRLCSIPPDLETIIVPAHFFPATFSATVPVIPTGTKTFPATTAHGTITITNGSVISQELPAGLIFTGNNGVEVVTDSAVFVPAGSASGYGVAYVAAHALVSGKTGNILALDIDSVEGSSLYIRNLRPFTGGQSAYSVKFMTKTDKQTALAADQTQLFSQRTQIKAILKSCSEKIAYDKAAHVTWNCLFASYPTFPYRSVRLEGNSLLVSVIYIPQTRPFPGK